MNDEPERFPPVRPPRLDDARDRQRQPPPPPPPVREYSRWPNTVALVFLIASLVVCGWGTLVYLNPYTPLNLFPPPTPLPIVVTATLAPTFPPTEGPTLTFTPLPLVEATDEPVVAAEPATSTGEVVETLEVAATEAAAPEPTTSLLDATAVGS